MLLAVTLTLNWILNTLGHMLVSSANGRHLRAFAAHIVKESLGSTTELHILIGSAGCHLDIMKKGETLVGRWR